MREQEQSSEGEENHGFSPSKPQARPRFVIMFLAIGSDQAGLACALPNTRPTAPAPSTATYAGTTSTDPQLPRRTTTDQPRLTALWVPQREPREKPFSYANAFSSQWSANGSSLNRGTSIHPVDR
jgi:hypothetical protein